MAWQDETIITLRVMLGDTDEAAPTYSDDSLEKTLLVGAKQVLASLTFDQEFVVGVNAGTLSPDPTAGANRNDAFVNLMTLRAAAILDRTEASLAARRGIVVKDGSSAIDLSRVAEAKRRLLERGGWNAAYEDAKFEYLYQRAQNVAGAAVLTPFRLYARQSLGGGSFNDGDGRDRNNFFT